MKNRMFTMLVVFTLLMSWAVSPVSAARNDNYTIVDLGGDYSGANGINDRGQIVGYRDRKSVV